MPEMSLVCNFAFRRRIVGVFATRSRLFFVCDFGSRRRFFGASATGSRRQGRGRRTRRAGELTRLRGRLHADQTGNLFHYGRHVHGSKELSIEAPGERLQCDLLVVAGLLEHRHQMRPRERQRPCAPSNPSDSLETACSWAACSRTCTPPRKTISSETAASNAHRNASLRRSSLRRASGLGTLCVSSIQVLHMSNICSRPSPPAGRGE